MYLNVSFSRTLRVEFKGLSGCVAKHVRKTFAKPYARTHQETKDDVKTLFSRRETTSPIGTCDRTLQTPGCSKSSS